MKSQSAKKIGPLVIYKSEEKENMTKDTNYEFTIVMSNNDTNNKEVEDKLILPQRSFKDWLENGKIREAQLLLRALNHKLRQEIVDLLYQKESLSVTDILIKLRLEQSVVSQHLGILRRAGIVETEKKGKYIYYSVNEGKMYKVFNMASNIAS